MRIRVAIVALLAAFSLVLATPTLALPPNWCDHPQHQDKPYCNQSPTPSPSPTVGPTSAPTPPPGDGMPIGDLPGWTQIFTDDFSTDIPLGSFPAATNGRWKAYPYPWTFFGGYYQPNIISVHDGTMDYWLHQEGGQWLQAATLPQINGVGNNDDQLYGRYAVRWRADALDRYLNAWLLWPQSENWPTDGEIDFPEGEFDSTMKGYIHHQNGTSGGDQTECTTGKPMGGVWYTTVIEWAPNSVKLYLDGALVCHVTTRIPNTPMHWVLQSTLAGSPPATGTQGHVLVDWVSAYRYAP